MHQHGSRTAPGLAVEIHDCRSGHHALWARIRTRVTQLLKVQAQIMAAIRAGLAGKCLHLTRVSTGIASIKSQPPGLPGTKGEIRPVGRRVIGGRGSHLPGDIRIRQHTAGVVPGIHRQDGLIPGEIGPTGFTTGGHFKFGAPEFLDLEGMVILRTCQPTQTAVGGQSQLYGTQVGVLGQTVDKIKTTQRIDIQLACAKRISLRIGELVGD